MGLFNFFSPKKSVKKKSNQAKGFSPQIPNTEPPLQTFILEPILTPSGLVDAPDAIHPVVLDADAHPLPPIHLSENFDQPTVETTHSVDEFSPQPTDDLNAHQDIFEDNPTNSGIESVPFLTGGETTFLPELPTPHPTFNSGVFTVGDTGQVSIDYLFDGGGYQGQLAIFSLEGMDSFIPDSDEFIHEAATRALSNSDFGHVVVADASEGAKFSASLLGEGNFNSGEYLGVKTYTMRPGDTFGVMLVPNATVQQVFDGHLEGANRPLFSLSTANPDQGLNIGQIADVTGDGHTFALEDLRVDGWTDHDYNDLIFRVSGATGSAVHLDNVIDLHHDWRSTEMGQALLDYVTPDNSEVVTDGGVHSPVEVHLILDTQHSTEPVESHPISTTDGVVSEPVEAHPIPDSPLPTPHSTDVGVGHSETQVVNPTPDSPLPSPQSTDVGVGHSDAVVTNPVEANPTPNSPLPTSSPSHQPLVGIIDTGLVSDHPDLDYSHITFGHDYIDGDDNPLLPSGEGSWHGTEVVKIIGATQDNGIGIDGINDDAPLWVGRAVGSGHWADSLVDFVQAAQHSEQPNAVVNLSFDLTQVQPDGTVTTRFELTASEWAALEYAREHHILIVAASGNEGGVISALGQASVQFDNIITIGAASGLERADYSSYGLGLDILAPGEGGTSAAAAR